MRKICVIGSLNMDLVVKVDAMPKGGQTIIGSNFKEVPGGKGANQAVAMARLGGKVSMIGKVGNDGFGQTMINALKSDNVDTKYISLEDCATGVALITVDKNAENSIVVAPGANYEVDKTYIDENLEAIQNSDIVVTQLETPIETINGFGQTMINALKSDNVDTKYISLADCATGVALITVDKNAENSIVVAPGANYEVDKTDIDENLEAIQNSDIVVTQLETPIETIKYALKKSKELNKYTILNPAPAVKLEDELIANVDLLTPNETELEILSGVEIECEEDILKAAKVMIDKGVKELIVTLGSKGSLYINKERSMFKKSYKVEAVDTTAAGDSYTGALTVAFSKGENIEEAMDFASKVGALSVMKEGAQSSLPTIDDVLNFGR